MGTPAFAWMPLTAFTDRRLGARDLRVLGVLFAHAGNDRTCWPAVGTLAELTGIDRRDVQRTIRRLEDSGWVRLEAGGGRASTSRYRLWTAPPADAAKRAGDSTAGELPQNAGELPARTYQNMKGNIDNPSCASPEARAIESGDASSGVLQGEAQTPTESKPKASGSEAAQMGDFAVFWDVYPRRRGKADALKAWKALKPDAELVERILASVERARASPDWRKEGGKFIPYPATWLRRHGWEDELEPDIDPLPPQRHGDGQRINDTVAALDSLFGGQHHEYSEFSEGHDVPGFSLRDRALPGARRGVLGPARPTGRHAVSGRGEGSRFEPAPLPVRR